MAGCQRGSCCSRGRSPKSCRPAGRRCRRRCEILEDDGLVHRFAGRGYLVGGAGVAAPPLRGDIRKLDLAISDEIDEALQSRGTWELVYDQVEAAVADCLIFGAFRIVEAELGDNLGVSRTVVRDVLVRLHERGLVRKNQSSHWIAGPLTAETVRQRFAIRGLIEPAALRQAEAAIRYDKVARICERLDHEVAGSEVGHLLGLQHQLGGTRAGTDGTLCLPRPQ